jgi:ribulose-5-phosphate 4-epimerase/fuculose-1-phosphate aldolase
MTVDRLIADLVDGGRVLAAERLVTAFGHLSGRSRAGRLVITPPRPLGSLDAAGAAGAFTELPLHDGAELPAGTPREAWIHMAIARTRPDVNAICRAQPVVATALTAVDVPILPLHGQGSLLGPQVPVFDDARLVRDEQRGRRLAEGLGAGRAIVLRGNGAVTTGATVGEAVALMWVLEASAVINQLAAAAGTPRPLRPRDQDAWRAAGGELLDRIWNRLKESSR